MRTLASLLALSAEEAGWLVERAGAGCADGDRPLAGRVVSVLLAGPASLPVAAWVAAAGRCGATVLREEDFGDPDLDSVALARAAARWSDLLVVSHPLRGFARAVAQDTGCATLNAGETGGEDPVAGLSLLAAAGADLPVSGSGPLRAAVCGDLRGSRSARALLGLLSALGANVLLVPAKGRDLPDDHLRRLARCTRRRPVRFEARSMRTLLDMVDTVLLANEEQPQLPLFREVGVPPGESARRARREVEDLDALFVAAAGGGPDRLVPEPFRTRRRGPLPEGAEHATTRGALEAALAFCAARASGAGTPLEREGVELRYRSEDGLRCRAAGCVASREPELAPPDFVLLDREPVLLECLYCGERTRAAFAGSRIERRFHPVGAAAVRRILDENLVLFRGRGEALQAQFEAPARRRRRTAPAPEAGAEAAPDPKG